MTMNAMVLLSLGLETGQWRDTCAEKYQYFTLTLDNRQTIPYVGT